MPLEVSGIVSGDASGLEQRRRHVEHDGPRHHSKQDKEDDADHCGETVGFLFPLAAGQVVFIRVSDIFLLHERPPYKDLVVVPQYLYNAYSLCARTLYTPARSPSEQDSPL